MSGNGQMASRKRHSINPKRALAGKGTLAAKNLENLAKKVRYRGSPYHKRAPGDFNLEPPAHPRPDKTLCDGEGMPNPVCSVRRAQRLLSEGVRAGLVSERFDNGFPCYIWAVRQNDKTGTEVFEARLDNRGKGTYHGGYPLLESDPFREEVLRVWNERSKSP